MNRNLFIGDRVYMGRNITLEVYPGARLVIGNNVNLTQDILISCHKKITIGDYTGIAERVSIRDTDHEFRQKAHWVTQGTLSETINIGKDVIVSLGTSVFKGSSVPDGAVLGAYSMIFRNTKIIAYGVYFGNPPKLMFMRKGEREEDFPK